MHRPSRRHPRMQPARRAIAHHGYLEERRFEAGVAVAATPRSEPGRPSISAALRSLCRDRTGQVSLGALADTTGTGGTALLLFVFAVASLVPGVAPAFGVAVCFLSIPLIAGPLLARKSAAPLPHILRRQQISRERLARLLERGLPRLERLEALLKPRLHWLTQGAPLCLAGFACLASGLLIVLPIPFGNTVPAIAVLLLALGISAADGLLVLAGFGAFVAALAFDIGMVVLSWDAITAVVHAAF